MLNKLYKFVWILNKYAWAFHQKRHSTVIVGKTWTPQDTSPNGVGQVRLHLLGSILS